MPLLRFLSLFALLALPAMAQDGQPLVVFASQLPSSALSLTRDAGPHGTVAAETECRMAARGAPCREVQRFTSGCGAMVHGGRDPRLIRIPYSPEVPVSTKTVAVAPTREAAEREALAQCQLRDRTAVCLVVFAGCTSSGTTFVIR